MSMKLWRRLFVLAAVLQGAWVYAQPQQDGLLQERPERVVSLNLCTDELLLQLADPSQIAALSWLARDPGLTWHAAEAARYPGVRGLAEEIIQLAPDLVLAGEFTTPTTLALLESRHVPIIRLPIAQSVADIRAQILEVAAHLGQTLRGRALVAELDDVLANMGGEAGDDAPRAALFQPNGQTAVAGSLLHDVMNHAGMRNLAANWPKFAPLPLERLLLENPDFLIVSTAGSAPSLATQLLDHPALRRGFDGVRTVRVPAQAWTCGTRNVARALTLLHDTVQVDG